MKGKAFQKESPGVLADSNGGRLFLNMGAQSGRGGGAGDGPPKYQFIRVRRDNPKGPENKKKTIKMGVCVSNGPGISRTERLCKDPVGDVLGTSPGKVL